MSLRRIIRKKHDSQILASSGTADIQKSTGAHNRRFVAIPHILLVRVGERRYSEILSVMELVMATFFVIEDREDPVELRPLYPLMRFKRRLFLNVATIAP